VNDESGVNKLSTQLNLKEFSAPENINDTQAAELIMSNAAKCPTVKHVAPNPELGIAELKGKIFKYIVEHKRGKIHVKTKMDYLLSVVLAMICSPFAVWFGYAFGRADITDFKAYLLPLALLLIAWGIIWTIAAILGKNEQKNILSYIYNVINGKTPTAEVPSAKGVSSNILVGVLPLLGGIVVLIINFVI